MKVRLSFLQKRLAADAGILPSTINPIVVVPGLLGTWPPAPAPKGRLDPISRVYANLIDGLRAIGYVQGVSLFIFPYDWRSEVEISARKLSDEVHRIRQMSPQKAGPRSPVAVDYSKVDLLGHSLGGLVARAFIQSDHYRDDVARLFTVATPHKGLIASYYAWEGGDSSFIGIPVEAARSMINLLEAREMPTLWKRAHRTYRVIRKQVSSDLFTYLNTHTLAVRDLLPTSDEKYLYSIDEQGGKHYYPFGPNPGYPVNPTLEKLNSVENLQRLRNLEEFQLFYSSSNRTPIRSIVEDNFEATKPLFPHGQPKIEQPEDNFSGGDNIVPLSSGRLDLPDEVNNDLPIIRTDLSETLKMSLNHVQIIGDPDPVRYILSKIARQPEHKLITPQIWDGPLVSSRRPNIAALFR